MYHPGGCLGWDSPKETHFYLREMSWGWAGDFLRNSVLALWIQVPPIPHSVTLDESLPSLALILHISKTCSTFDPIIK